MKPSGIMVPTRGTARLLERRASEALDLLGSIRDGIAA